MAETKNFMVEDATLLFRNFSGEESSYNAAGKRNFCVILDPKVASDMEADGWNVKTLRARDEGDEDTRYIKVAVNFKVKPPKITLITSTSRTLLGQDLVGTLDWADFRTVDLIARAYDWEVGEKAGIAAYLQTMFVTIEEDALEAKYAALAAL